MNQIFESNTRLYGARLWIVRALWLIFVGSILIMFCIVAYENLFEPLSVCETNACAMTPAEYARWQATGIRPEFANFTTGIVFGLVMPLVFFLVAVIIAWRRSDDWMGLLVSFALVGLGPYLLTGVNLTMSARPGWNILTNVLQSATVFTFGSLFYLFPDGRVVPRGARRLLWVIFILLCASGIVDATHVLNRFGAHAQEQSDALGILIFFVVFLIGLGAQVYRYRRVSNLIQRQQTKWIIVGLLGPILTLAIWFAIFPMINSGGLAIRWTLILLPVMAVSAMALPFSIGFAILRYRLYDIDIIIRRTLIYSILTAFLALFYFGSVVVLQQILRPFIGQNSDIAIIISTLTIAALFNPLRGRVQQVIDQRFYRRKYDAQQVLARFAATARDEVELERLSDELLAVVSETMQPASASLWLRKTEREVEQ